MEKINQHFEKLSNLREQTIAANYLKETPLADLRTKIIEMNGAAKLITDTWEKPRAIATDATKKRFCYLRINLNRSQRLSRHAFYGRFLNQ